MMLDAESWAKNKGFNCFYVKSWSEALDFYKKCGYVVNDDLYDDDGLVNTTLTKELWKLLTNSFSQVFKKPHKK